MLTRGWKPLLLSLTKGATSHDEFQRQIVDMLSYKSSQEQSKNISLDLQNLGSCPLGNIFSNIKGHIIPSMDLQNFGFFSHKKKCWSNVTHFFRPLMSIEPRSLVGDAPHCLLRPFLKLQSCQGVAFTIDTWKNQRRTPMKSWSSWNLQFRFCFIEGFTDGNHLSRIGWDQRW